MAQCFMQMGHIVPFDYALGGCSPRGVEPTAETHYCKARVPLELEYDTGPTTLRNDRGEKPRRKASRAKGGPNSTGARMLVVGFAARLAAIKPERAAPAEAWQANPSDAGRSLIHYPETRKGDKVNV
jgi:hypothetical protein